MSYSLFDKDEHWHKPEQAFLTDDHRDHSALRRRGANVR